MCLHCKDKFFRNFKIKGKFLILFILSILTMGIVKIVVYMIPLIAILENGFDSFVCGSVIIYQIRKDSHHPSFSWIETWNHATCIV